MLERRRIENPKMSQSYHFDRNRLVLSMPDCAQCGAPMWLARIEPDIPGHDKRTFPTVRECGKRDRQIPPRLTNLLRMEARPFGRRIRDCDLRH